MSDDGEVDEAAVEGELEAVATESLRALREAPAPPAELLAQIVAALRAERLLGGDGARPRWWLALAGLAAAAALGGFGVGYWLRGERLAEPLGEQFVLLLEETGERVPATAEAATVAEYAAWAAGWRQQGLDLSGQKLDDARTLLAPGGGGRVETGPAKGALAGYFLLRARDAHEALVIAGTCPHLRHGGTVEVRRVARRPAR